MRARTVLFLKGISAAIFSLRSCTAYARVLSLCMRSARDGSCSLGVLGGSAAKWTNVVWPIKSRQTNKPTNTHYSFIGIDKPVRIYAREYGAREVRPVFSYPLSSIFISLQSVIDYSSDLECHGVASLADLTTFDLQLTESVDEAYSLDCREGLPVRETKARSSFSDLQGERKPVTSLDNITPPDRDLAILHRILAHHLPLMDPVRN